MFKKRLAKNEKGLTLIEVLASILILSIVLISFSSLLLQSAKHTKMNREKLTAVEVAEDIIAQVREGIYEEEFINQDQYPGYGFKIEISDGPEEDLKTAKIIVHSLSNQGPKKSPFTTYMYFETNEGSS